jgi:hypothetical protein
VTSLAVWLTAAVGGQIAAARGRAAEPEAEVGIRRRLVPVLIAEHIAFVVLLASGAALMEVHGWGLGRARWLALKVGLVGFLVVPLEAMHTYVAHGWISPGLRRSQGGALAPELARGLGIEEMLRTLAIPLLGVGLPLVLWLSIAKPS